MDDLLIPCPNCNAEVCIPEGAQRVSCDACQTLLHVESQLAYLRAVDAFEEGQKIMNQVSPRRRRLYSNPNDVQAMDLFKEAYTAMQIAFQEELAEPQRQLGVEMMAAMSREFSVRLMVSGLEASYWMTLAVEQTAQSEYDRLSEKLKSTSENALNFFPRLRWRSRKNQLAHELKKLDQKITALERQIAFVEVPRGRNRKWSL